jgi:hypothetical protein
MITPMIYPQKQLGFCQLLLLNVRVELDLLLRLVGQSCQELMANASCYARES